MVKVLQRKFIVTAMAAVSILLLVLIGTINVANGWISSRQSDQQLKMLMDTEQQIMRQNKQAFASDDVPELDISEHDMQNRFMHPPDDGNTKKRSFFNPPIDEDMAMSLRFFIVCLDADNQVLRSDVSRIASVSGEEAETYAQRAAKAEKTIGYLDRFKYQVLIVESNNTQEQIEKIFIFLDVSGQFHSIWMVIVLSISIAVGCWLCMLLLIILLSRKAIRPIAQNMQKQRQFVTDAGHEIKTPLAIIQANIDAMELINGENKWSRNIRNQTNRLSGLMQNLLTLAKMDEESLLLPMEDFCISELLENAVQSFYESADLKGIHVEKDIKPDIFIHANREYMQRLSSILLDNAVKYADVNGKISVSLQKNDQAAVLRVINTCEELPKDDAEKLFDRFYRGDAARTQKGGYGIGLSAAYAIVKAHKGDLFAEYMDQNTIAFTVRIYYK